jgi:hypothetical protein
MYRTSCGLIRPSQGYKVCTLLSTVQLLCTVKEQRGKLDRKPYPPRNLKSENLCPETSTKLYVHEFSFSTCSKFSIHYRYCICPSSMLTKACCAKQPDFSEFITLTLKCKICRKRMQRMFYRFIFL